MLATLWEKFLNLFVHLEEGLGGGADKSYHRS